MGSSRQCESAVSVSARQASGMLVAGLVPGCLLFLFSSQAFATDVKIQFVSSFPDYKVKIVDSFADLHVQQVTAFPDAPGKWQIVDSFPDYKIQIVDSFPDFTIKYVEAFPGPQ
jgi:hypothetical protein